MLRGTVGRSPAANLMVVQSWLKAGRLSAGRRILLGGADGLRMMIRSRLEASLC